MDEKDNRKPIPRSPEDKREIEKRIITEVRPILNEEIKTAAGKVENDVRQIEAQKKKEEGFKMPITQGRITQLSQLLRSNFSRCWQGACRPISWVMIVCYFILFLLIFGCTYFNFSICLTRGPLGGAPYVSIIAVIGLGISLFTALRSPDSLPALIFSLVIALPAVILILFSVIQYIGYILIGLVLLYILTQGNTRR